MKKMLTNHQKNEALVTNERNLKKQTFQTSTI